MIEHKPMIEHEPEWIINRAGFVSDNHKIEHEPEWIINRAGFVSDQGVSCKLGL
jgi:hypothetical protein